MAGPLGDARAAFDIPVAEGHVSAPAFTALATAFANVSDLAGLDGVLAAARTMGQMSSPLVLSGILAQRQCAVSLRTLEEGRVAGFADVMRYTVVISACHQVGGTARPREWSPPRRTTGCRRRARWRPEPGGSATLTVDADTHGTQPRTGTGYVRRRHH